MRGRCQFICFNGKMVPAEEPVITHNNRAFCYGDAVFETIRGNGTKLFYFKDHYSRLIRGLKILGIAEKSIPSENELEKILVKLLNKNHYYTGVRIRLTVFRNSGGYYTPVSSDGSYLAEATLLPNHTYTLNDKGLTISIYSKMAKEPNLLAGIKQSNSLLYVLAGLEGKQEGYDEMLLINSNKNVIESVSSNLFLVKENKIFTPPVSEGCVDGIMRKQIIRIASAAGINCIEQSIESENIMECDELFLTNSITGIKWVVAYKQKRYFKKISKELLTILNSEQL